ncbi:MAG: hypothetical protein ABEH43_10910, partial [Flavobacteriales bacterium]
MKRITTFLIGCFFGTILNAQNCDLIKEITLQADTSSNFQQITKMNYLNGKANIDTNQWHYLV